MSRIPLATVIVLAGAWLIVGLPFWFQPYAGLSLPSGLLHPGLLAIPLAAAWLRTRSSGWGAIRSIGVAATIAPAVVMARVIVETANDPTSHNLWPFELLIAGLVGLLVAGIGVATVAILRHLRP